MLFTPAALEGIAAGRVTLAFRRWDRPRVKVGSTITNALGVVEIVSVEQVDSISDTEAEAAGFTDAAALNKIIDKQSRSGGQLYRVGVRYGGPDPRHALRADVSLTADDVEDLRKRLARMDAQQSWTREYLRLIEANPDVVARVLAAQVGMETAPFKLRVRRLKNLGLTESLPVGYRLSPRGKAFLDSETA
ncbi:hypothetical protein [Antrihabitans spumae]|uniref:ASCH domain-containing protein n=1 Tax=Antrihabitans spumae TaxID=3373370 RepID=A0ABW7JYH1_9NOCA